MADQERTPIEILADVSPVAAKTYMDHRKAVMENPEAQALPAKIKLLVGIGVAAALQSSTCTLMWVKHARKAGATDAEIAEWCEAAALTRPKTTTLAPNKREALTVKIWAGAKA